MTCDGSNNGMISLLPMQIISLPSSPFLIIYVSNLLTECQHLIVRTLFAPWSHTIATTFIPMSLQRKMIVRIMSIVHLFPIAACAN